MSTIEKNVMASVAAIYAFRLATGLTAFKLYMLIASALGLVFFVSLPNVVQNFLHVASTGVGGVGFFIVAAFFGTTFFVQAIVLVGLLAAFSLSFDFVRAFSLRGLLNA
jgi:hypothetical protein